MLLFLSFVLKKARVGSVKQYMNEKMYVQYRKPTLPTLIRISIANYHDFQGLTAMKIA